MVAPATFALLHGGGQGSWVWADVARRLEAAGAHVLLLDVPGCGTKRGRDIESIATEAVVAELNADIVASGMAPVVLVGHSLAGALMPRMAEAAPELFQHLVYLTCSTPLAGQSFSEMIGTGLHGQRDDAIGWPVDMATVGREARNRIMFCNDMDAPAADAFIALLGQDLGPMETMTRTDWRFDHLATIPSTYILCERDGMLPVEWQERFAERFKCDRTERIDAGHQAMTTQPDRVAELLLAAA